MSNEIVPNPYSLPANLAAAFDLKAIANELSGGVQQSFAVISIRGSKFRVSYQGEERMILNDEGEPKGYMDVVILKGSEALAKIYYEKKYEEGDDAAPDCFSTDGVRPDEGAPKPQNDLCATCPKYAWGSAVTESGDKRRACQDNRRVAVVPAKDIKNEHFGGAMLLRVPAASLKPLDKYSRDVQKNGLPYFAVVTRIGFDPDASYPKLTFKVVGTISDAEDGAAILEMRDNEATSYVLTGSGDFHSEPATTAEPDHEPAKVVEMPKPAAEAKPKKEAKPKEEAKPKAKEEPAEVNEAAPEASDELNDQLGALLEGL